MKAYSTIHAFNSYNAGLLAGVRAKQGEFPAPVHEVRSEEESRAWCEGINDGQKLRMMADNLEPLELERLY